jgi:hypothetical protein
VYVGSGTSAKDGVRSRLKSYEPGASNVPRYVKKAFNDGFIVAHKGLLCWTPLPSAGFVPRLRARFLLLEALFTIMFHACISMVTDSYVEDFTIWPRGSVGWGPLCSHLSLKEFARGDLGLSFEELETIAKVRRARAKEVQTKASQNFRARQGDEYRTRTSAQKLVWTDKNRAKVTKQAAKTRAKAIASDRFRCETCSISLQSQLALDKHLVTQAHQDCVNGIVKGPKSQKAINDAKAKAQAKMDSVHRCEPCNKSFPNDWSLTRHINTGLHERRAAAAASSSS